jgi:hypothetical protein
MMSARPKSSIVYLPPVAGERFVKDETFLRSVSDLLEGLGAECDLRGHNMLASLLAIAKGEAEDGLHTRETDREIGTESDEDDGAAMMAQRLACRVGGSA